MKVKPLKNRLLVKIEEPEEATKSGIILVGNTKENPNIAAIVETADYYEDNQEVFIKGDRVLFNPQAGIKVKLEEVDYLIISYKDILAILN